PQLAKNRLDQLEQYLSENHANAIAESFLIKTDTFKNSFLKPTRAINFRKKVQTIKDIALSGNIMLFSDTTVIIDNSAVLDNILVFAKSIIVKSEFHGTCQLFATDSIYVEPNCIFNYPSCLGVLRSKSGIPGSFVKIELGKNTKFNGTIFTYQQKKEDILPLISLDKDVIISGQVYSQGMLKYKSNFEINGSVFTRLFIYQSSFNLMENMLIDAKINAKALSPYYLSSDLMTVSSKKKKILQWLEKN
ncbi:MAG: hypothetical protein JWQ57_205, partial [Mucilaginibacter sp.]|nr:hypothetical protein [Mucilaginibacter sp.]